MWMRAKTLVTFLALGQKPFHFLGNSDCWKASLQSWALVSGGPRRFRSANGGTRPLAAKHTHIGLVCNIMQHSLCSGCHHASSSVRRVGHLQPHNALRAPVSQHRYRMCAASSSDQAEGPSPHSASSASITLHVQVPRNLYTGQRRCSKLGVMPPGCEACLPARRSGVELTVVLAELALVDAGAHCCLLGPTTACSLSSKPKQQARCTKGYKNSASVRQAIGADSAKSSV
jgi:hypothetical protein